MTVSKSCYYFSFKIYCDTSLELPHLGSSNAGVKTYVFIEKQEKYLRIILKAALYLEFVIPLSMVFTAFYFSAFTGLH